MEDVEASTGRVCSLCAVSPNLKIPRAPTWVSDYNSL